MKKILLLIWAVDYRKDANYYLDIAKEYQRESIYYTRKGEVD